MENKSICRRVSSMLSLYIDNQVTYQESAFIEDHISNCAECRAKYLYLQSLVKELKDSYKLVLEAAKKKQEQKIFSIREHERFLNQLYPYVDNELDEIERDEVKNYLTKSDNAKKELKNIYKVQKELKTSYDKIKSSLNTDFSQKIINELKLNKEHSDKQIFQFPVFSVVSKSVKIAVLFGVVVWGGYEAESWYHNFDKQTKPPVIEQEQNSIDKVKINFNQKI